MRYITPNTNIGIGGIRDAFPNTVGSLYELGNTQRWPRVSTNVSINNHFRNRTFYWWNVIDTLGGTDSVVEITSPMSLGPANSINTSLYQIDSSVYSTMTLKTSAYSGTFYAWLADGEAEISTQLEVTITLSDWWSYSSITAQWF